MNIDRNWFAPSPVENFSTARQDEERREIRRAMLATLVLIIVGLLATAVLPRPDPAAEAGQFVATSSQLAP